MNQQNNITTIELYYLVYGNNSLHGCIKTFFVEALIKKAISIKEYETTDNKKSFFVRNNCIKQEMILQNFLEVIFNTKDIMSLQEFATICSNFLNYKFRMTSPDYRIDKRIKQSLIDKNLLVMHRFIFIKSFKKTDKAKKVLSELNLLRLNPFQFAAANNGIKPNEFCEKFEKEINNFDMYLQDALDRRITTVAPMIELGKKYPIIKE